MNKRKRNKKQKKKDLKELSPFRAMFKGIDLSGLMHKISALERMNLLVKQMSGNNKPDFFLRDSNGN